MDADQPHSPSSPDILLPQPATASTPADERSFHIRLAVFASVVIIAIVGAFVGYPTWQEYISQQEAKLELRAYVNVRALGPPALKEGLSPRVRETIQNTGRTPAYNDAIQAFITVADYPLIRNFERVTCPRTIRNRTNGGGFWGKSREGIGPRGAVDCRGDHGHTDGQVGAVLPRNGLLPGYLPRIAPHRLLHVLEMGRRPPEPLASL